MSALGGTFDRHLDLHVPLTEGAKEHQTTCTSQPEWNRHAMQVQHDREMRRHLAEHERRKEATG